MELATWSPTPKRPLPPPLWLVTDGDATVGPVPTTLLVRGVIAGRVPDTCYVRDTKTQAWRPVHAVREVRAATDDLYRRPKGTADADDISSLEALLELTEDRQEALLLGLQIAARRMRATFGLAHGFDDLRKPPVTRFVHGAGTDGRLGEPLPDGDGLLHVARARCIALGEPRSSHEFRDAAARLGGGDREIRGVAMVPIVKRHALVGMIELGRADHPFRAADAVVLREVVRRVGQRI